MIEAIGPVLLECQGTDTLDLSTTNEATMPIGAMGWEFASFQAERSADPTGTYATAVLTVQQSLNRFDFRSTSITIPAGGGFGTSVLTVSAPWVRVKVTTPEGGAGRARVWAFFWNSNVKQGG